MAHGRTDIVILEAQPEPGSERHCALAEVSGVLKVPQRRGKVRAALQLAAEFGERQGRTWRPGPGGVCLLSISGP
ncbi:hypothetical protein, partial [Pseudomonas nitroreducens]|uniref:hypothetical protein n=1 Tax=Pseudomonas nitroreducens TaxID=46680 RepID=UPI001E30B070